jgi:hypothetical protein
MVSGAGLSSCMMLPMMLPMVGCSGASSAISALPCCGGVGGVASIGSPVCCCSGIGIPLCIAPFILPAMTTEQCQNAMNQITPICNQGVFLVSDILSALTGISNSLFGGVCSSLNSILYI